MDNAFAGFVYVVCQKPFGLDCSCPQCRPKSPPTSFVGTSTRGEVKTTGIESANYVELDPLLDLLRQCRSLLWEAKSRSSGLEFRAEVEKTVAAVDALIG